MRLDVSLADGLDRLTILEIKQSKITSADKLAEIQKEIDALHEFIPFKMTFAFQYKLLFYTNLRVWEFMDTVNATSMEKRNTIEFAQLAAKVYEYNDQRFRIKRLLNTMANSELKEQKSYGSRHVVVAVRNVKLCIPIINYLSVQYDTVSFVSESMDTLKTLFTTPNFLYTVDATVPTVDADTFDLPDRSAYEFSSMKIPLMKSTFLGEQETKDALCAFIQGAGKLSMGDEVAKFESLFAEWQGRAHSVMVNSGSSANLVILQSLLNLGRLKKGDRIGVSAVTWATNVMPVIQLGFVPILIDIDPTTLNISCSSVKAHEIECLFITHLLGFHGDIEEITAYCKEKSIILLEDTCESLGTSCNDVRLGNFGLASSFSTFVGHHMSTIEGGLIATDDAELNKMIRMVRAHGWDRNVTAAERADLRSTWGINDFYGPYTFYALGYNVRPTDLQGLIGSIQLKHIDAANEQRRTSFRRIRTAAQAADVVIPNQDVPAFAIPIVCSSPAVRDRYVQTCRDMGIETRPIVAGNMNKQPFFENYKTTLPLPHADRVHECGFYIPNHPDLTVEEINYLSSIFINVRS